MTQRITSSRIASIAAIVLALILVVWLFWPPPNELHKLNAVEPEARSASETDKTRPSTSMQEKKRTKTKDERVVTATEPQNDTATFKEPVDLTTDFRVEDPDNYATLKHGEFLTTTGVEDLEPGAHVREFSKGQRVYAYAALHAPRPETVKITWYGPDNKSLVPSAYLDVQMNMGPVGYRVYTWRSFRDTGQHRVAIFNSTGAKLGEQSFTVK